MSSGLTLDDIGKILKYYDVMYETNIDYVEKLLYELLDLRTWKPEFEEYERYFPPGLFELLKKQFPDLKPILTKYGELILFLLEKERDEELYRLVRLLNETAESYETEGYSQEFVENFLRFYKNWSTVIGNLEIDTGIEKIKIKEYLADKNLLSSQILELKENIRSKDKMLEEIHMAVLDVYLLFDYLAFLDRLYNALLGKLSWVVEHAEDKKHAIRLLLKFYLALYYKKDFRDEFKDVSFKDQKEYLEQVEEVFNKYAPSLKRRFEESVFLDATMLFREVHELLKSGKRLSEAENLRRVFAKIDYHKILTKSALALIIDSIEKYIRENK